MLEGLGAQLTGALGRLFDHGMRATGEKLKIAAQLADDSPIDTPPSARAASHIFRSAPG